MNNLHAKQTCLVILGSSDYPNCKHLSNLQFKRSAVAVREYFLSRSGFDLPACNVLDLFDNNGKSSEQINNVAEFVRGFLIKIPDEITPSNVILYCVSHGHIARDDKFKICLGDYSDDNERNGLVDLGELIEATYQTARQSRIICIIDACFSGAAYKSITGSSSPSSKGNASRGISVLSSTSGHALALALADEDLTLFTGMLLDALKTPHPLIKFQSLADLHHKIIENIDRLNGLNGSDLPRPELHDPDQKAGQISKVGLFPVLKSESFPSNVPTFLVIERKNRESGEALSTVVGWVRNSYSTEIIESANMFRAELNLTLFENLADINVEVLYIEDALSNWGSLANVVAKLCRADICAFDLTDWDVGAIFLLGIRSVVRRGITICSTDGMEHPSLGPVPFNLQLLNITPHGSNEAARHVAEKVVAGFSEISSLPGYLDLPSYDSVRQIGYLSPNRRNITCEKGVLVLCSFEQEFTKSHWNYFKNDFCGNLRRHLRYKKVTLERDRPEIYRLLDIVTPRLIAQKLFESIRLTDMCLIDWTGMRPNVVFEAGVRMAVNQLGAVHVIDASHQNLSNTASQHALINLFKPINYNANRRSSDDESIQKMIELFEANSENHNAWLRKKLSSSSTVGVNVIYETAGHYLDLDNDLSARHLIDQMVREADFMDASDKQSEGGSPLLYWDVNDSIKSRVADAAAEKRLAAWFYMTKRWTAIEIASDPSRRAHFNILAALVEKWATKNKRTDIKADLQTLMLEVEKISTPFPAENLRHEH